MTVAQFLMTPIWPVPQIFVLALIIMVWLDDDFESQKAKTT